ncbi:MAG TPA: 4'-phosphopantetheinyl transferase superfamily protein [Bryobacteraceae bacterium]|nr:4'-phosphopantetheinyl transferase superfamily protein [Bryobacteraceae bacterium]
MGLPTSESPWLRLQSGVCDLWYWRPATALPEPLRRRALAFLSPEEIARYERYRVAAAAETFLAARVLVRSVLSAYAPLLPPAWRFETNHWGRPYIANPESPPGLLFNLSHKPGALTCLAGRGRDLGVDIEHCAQRPYLLEIASRFFSPSETAALFALPEQDRIPRFYQLWTLKEAYIKARGIGLSLGLSNFSFSPSGNTATVRFEPGFSDDPYSWDFRLFRILEDHLIATAIRRSDTPLRVEPRDAAQLVARALA